MVLIDEISLFLRGVSLNVSVSVTFGSRGTIAKTDKPDGSTAAPYLTTSCLSLKLKTSSILIDKLGKIS
jgi:hypothetical protein